MSRDPTKLEAFTLADALVLDVYRATSAFPREERYGLQIQIRRAAVSTAVNLVEGSARQSTREYLHFVSIAIGSASEAKYLIGVADRLAFIDANVARDLRHRYWRVMRALQSLTQALKGAGDGRLAGSEAPSE